MNRRSRSRFYNGKVLKSAPFQPHIGDSDAGWEIIKAIAVKIDTKDHYTDFEPLSPQLLERFERWWGQVISAARKLCLHP